MTDYILRITSSSLAVWRRRWPCSTLTTGCAVFDGRTGDLIDLGGRLSSADVDGHEFNAYVDDHQSRALAAVRGQRCR